MMTQAQLSQAGQKGGKARKHRWSGEEQAIVVRDYNHTRESIKLLAAKLGVTYFAVRGQIAILGLARDGRKPWSPQEDKRLGGLIPKYAPITVAKRMGRSVNSVVVRSKRLGIMRRYRDGWYTKMEVCRILGVDHHWIQSRIDSGALKASYHFPDHKPCQKGMSCWHIKDADLRKYIVSYCGELNGRHVDVISLVDILVPNHQLAMEM
jgi:hypothetical protein